MPDAEMAAPLASESLMNFAKVIREVRRWRLDFAIYTPEPVSNWQLGHLSFAKFINDASTRDLGRLILSTLNRSPTSFGIEVAQRDNQNLEYFFEGRPSKGLGFAHLSDGLALSLFINGAWSDSIIDVTRTIMEANTYDEVLLKDESVTVRHVSSLEHVTAHRTWLEKAGKFPFASFEQFQAERPVRLSRIEFLDNALNQLRSLIPTHPWWRAAFARLDELQAAMIEWDPNSTPLPAWRSHVSGEMETRRMLCNFVDRDGVTRCFDMHARFTPGAGRLHFRVQNAVAVPQLIVAHIGKKLSR